MVVLAGITQMVKAIPDGFLLHRGNPQALDGLCAAALGVHQPEDQLALAPSIRRADDAVHLPVLRQSADQLQLLTGLFARNKCPRLGHNRQVVPAPAGISRIVGLGLRQLHQMPQAPCDQRPVSFQIAVPATAHTQHPGNGLRYARLLRDNQHFHGFFCLLRAERWGAAFCSSAPQSAGLFLI